MAFYLDTVGEIEKLYPFEDAVAGDDMLNGDCGEVEDGVFSVCASASKAVMQVEVGDFAGADKYPILKGDHVRVVDFEKLNGLPVQIYGAQLPDDFAVGDTLASDDSGKLVTGGSAPCFTVTKVIGSKSGAEAIVTME